MAVIERFKSAWNAFNGRVPRAPSAWEYAYASSSRPDRTFYTRGKDRGIVTTIINQIAVDCSAINVLHVRVNDEGRYVDTINDSFNYALTKSANRDQTGRAFVRDAVQSLLDEGVIAVVPVMTDGNPWETDSYEILELRVGKVTQWFPHQVEVDVYNEDTGKHERLRLEKRFTAIVENPFYNIMNEPNSTAQRLVRLLNQIDRTNEQNASGKLDLLIQLPYVARSDRKKEYAETRLKDIETQLTNSQFGIAYTDGTEKIVQLNRPLENNLWQQAQDLTEQLFNQLGLSKAIFDGSSDDQTQLNYYNRTIEPILSALTEEMERKFLSKTAVTQGQAIRFFRDPFKLVPAEKLAEIADKMTRNEIMSSNDIRAIIGLKPDENPKSDQLVNSNLNQPDAGAEETDVEMVEETEEGQDSKSPTLSEYLERKHKAELEGGI